MSIKIITQDKKKEQGSHNSATYKQVVSKETTQTHGSLYLNPRQTVSHQVEEKNCKAGGKNTKEKRGWKQLCAQSCKWKPSLPAPLLQVPLYHRYEVLNVKDLSEGGNSPFSLDMLIKPNQERPSPNTKTTTLKKRWELWVIPAYRGWASSMQNRTFSVFLFLWWGNACWWNRRK